MIPVLNMSFTGDEEDLEFKEVHLMSGFSRFALSNHFSREEALVKNLRKFRAKPPPDEVTSLKLTGFRELEDLTLSQDAMKTWINFVVFWYPKLCILEVDYFDNLFCPNKSFVNQLLAAPLLTRFHCCRIKEKLNSDPEQPLIIEFPQRLFHLPNLKIVYFDMKKNSTLLEFYERLARSPQLATYRTRLTDYNKDTIKTHFKGLITLIKQSKIKELNVELFEDWRHRDPSYFLEVFTEFGAAIAGSNARISIAGLFPKMMYDHLNESLGIKKAQLFFNCVQRTEELPSSALHQFPNLKILDRLTETGSESYPVFPERLEGIRMSGRFPLNLPSSLTHLEITKYSSNCFELMNTLMYLSLSGFSPMKKFKLEWKLFDGFYLDQIFPTPDFQAKKPFPSNLICFNFNETI